MSRLVGGYDGLLVTVRVREDGRPTYFEDGAQATPVLHVVEHFREWIGVLDGEPQRDVWRVVTGRGLCELHHLCFPTGDDTASGGTWLLARWAD